MERYSNELRFGNVLFLTLLLILLLLVTAKYCNLLESRKFDLTAKNQYLNNDCSSDKANFSQHSFALAMPIDIIDYNDIHKVYRLFNFSGIHHLTDCFNTSSVPINLEPVAYPTGNYTALEKTIQLRSILI